MIERVKNVPLRTREENHRYNTLATTDVEPRIFSVPRDSVTRSVISANSSLRVRAEHDSIGWGHSQPGHDGQMHLLAAHSTDTRDLRLDLFRGIANWAIFVDHIPNNVVSWLTMRNYGFSDAADLFVFISGYAASLVCAKIMAERGFGIAAARTMKRVWQIYAAHVLLLVAYVAVVGYVAQHYDTLDLANEFNIAGLINNPVDTLTQGLLLRFKPLNLDVLPLYVALMTFLPPVIWLMLRAPDLAMGASLLVYLAARHFGWNLSAYPAGVWYFNPFAWQLLFVFGSWFAIGGATKARHIIRSRSLLYLGTAYLVFSLAMTMAGRFPEFADIFPGWLVGAFNPNDKTNLAPYRVVHFVILVFLVARFVPQDWTVLKSKLLQPVIACGQQSLKVFCVGLFLSFSAHFVLEIGSGSVWAQMLVSAVGLFLMSAVAHLFCWFKRIEKLRNDLAPSHKMAVILAPEEPGFCFPKRDLPTRVQWLDSVQRPFPEVTRLPRSHALVSRH